MQKVRFLQLTWPFLATAIWVVIFEGATFFVGRKGTYVVRALALIGGVSGIFFAVVHFYRCVHL